MSVNGVFASAVNGFLGKSSLSSPHQETTKMWVRVPSNVVLAALFYRPLPAANSRPTSPNCYIFEKDLDSRSYLSFMVGRL